MFDLLIEDNRDVSWGSVMSWAERLWLLEVSEIKMSFARSPSREPPKTSRAFKAIFPCFEGSETKQNLTQRQQSIEGLHKLSKAKLLKI
jgi:hypothetical protein